MMTNQSDGAAAAVVGGEPEKPFLALVLDAEGVYVDKVELASSAELGPQHVDLRPYGGDCDRAVGRYRWDAEKKTLLPLAKSQQRGAGGSGPSLEGAFASLLEELERQGFKLNDRLMVWRAGYRNSLDAAKGGR
jgi:hypothetical protein